MIDLPSKVVVFRDLDGTLLYRVTYSYVQTTQFPDSCSVTKSSLSSPRLKLELKRQLYQGELGN